MLNATTQGTDGYRDLPDGSIKAVNPTLSWRPDDRTVLGLDFGPSIILSAAVAIASRICARRWRRHRLARKPDDRIRMNLSIPKAHVA